MHEYHCDQCGKVLDGDEPVYTLTMKRIPQREQHFHWDCLKKYVKEA